MNQLIECVPNFSAGKDTKAIEAIVNCFRNRKGVRLLDYRASNHHNRLVVTLVGEYEALKLTILEAVGKAIDCIDMRRHQGEHPRIGAVDVIPFIPVRGTTLEECTQLAKETGEEIAKLYSLPVYLYGKAASSKARETIFTIREGEYEGLEEKMRHEEWQPDYGPNVPHATAGAVAVGSRMPLIALNVNLRTNRIEIAEAIAQKLMKMDLEKPLVRAFAARIPEKDMVQVSVTLPRFTNASLYRVVESVRFEAKRWGVTMDGSEIVGILPTSALAEIAEHYLGLNHFSQSQVLECSIAEETY